MAGLWDRLRALLRTEKAELDDALADAERRGNAALDAKERALHATPEEKLRLEQERAAAADAEYEALKRQIEGDAGSS
jgi:hypothetical protein